MPWGSVRVQGAPGDRVEQRAHHSAVDRADGVVGRLVGSAGEHHAARLGLGHVELHQARDGWRRQFAGDDCPQVVHAGHRQSRRGGRAGFVPGDGLGPRGPQPSLLRVSASSAVTVFLSVRRCGQDGPPTGSPVPVAVGIVGADGVVFAPRQQGVEHGQQCAPGLGQLVVETRRRRTGRRYGRSPRPPRAPSTVRRSGRGARRCRGRCRRIGCCPARVRGSPAAPTARRRVPGRRQSDRVALAVRRE